MKNSIGYFLYNERPMSGLINSQVISLLRNLKGQKPDLLITIVAFWQPWIYIAYRKELKDMRAILLRDEIKFRSYPFAIPERHFFSNPFLLNLSESFVSLFLFIVLKFNKFSVLHSRGYFAALCAVKLKRSFKDMKVIFDGRSLYPLECITLGKFNFNDRIFNIWENKEKKILEIASYSIGVSRPIVDYYKKKCPGSSVRYIPCNVNTDVLYFCSESRDKIRRTMRWENQKVMVYIGSISVSFWNDIRIYREYFKKMLVLDNDLFFLIITNSNQDILETELKGHLPDRSYKIISSSHQEMRSWLSASDFGIQVMNEMPDSFSRLGVKLTEYFACGLPVVVNKHVGAAKGIVEVHDLGLVLEIDDSDFSSKFEDFMNKLGVNNKEKFVNYANSEFSLDTVTQKYLQLYC